MDEPREFFVVCTLGLEPVVAAELRELGVEAPKVGRGGVSFSGRLELAYRANLWLRAAIRVQETIGRGELASVDDLYRWVRSFDWGGVITPRHTLAIDATINCTWLTHSGYAAQVVKDAIVDQLRDRTGDRSSVDRRAPDVPLKLVVRRNEALLYRNMSGPSLHKRGWRKVQVKSPLNEATAAGLLLLAGWRGGSLYDPMCGSGTFLIEAAHLAMDRAPGLHRRYPFERWPDFDAELWQGLRDEAARRLRADASLDLRGADSHPGAVAIARASAEAAGVDHLVRFEQRPAGTTMLDAPPETVVVNPPYGERLGEDAGQLYDAWRQLARFLHEQCAGARAYVLSGNAELTRLLRLRASRKWAVRNGPIDCRWLCYEIR